MQSNCRENFILDFHTTLRYISTVFSVSVRSEGVGERGGCTHSAYSFWLLSSSVPPPHSIHTAITLACVIASFSPQKFINDWLASQSRDLRVKTALYVVCCSCFCFFLTNNR